MNTVRHGDNKNSFYIRCEMTSTSLGGEEQISISGKRMIGKADESL